MKDNYIIESILGKYSDKGTLTEKVNSKNTDSLFKNLSKKNQRVSKSDFQAARNTRSLKEALTFQDWLDKTFYPGFDPTDLSDEEYYELEDAYYAECNFTDESLKEARNPENDEVNAVIRKWANSDRNRLSKKDQEILDKNGLSLEDDAWRKGAKRIVGPVYNKDNRDRNMTKGYVKGTHPDYDLKGYLSKKPQSYGDTEVPIGWWNSSYVKANKDDPYAAMNARHRKDARQKMSSNQFKSLQPYADEKKELRQNNGASKDAYKRAKEVQALAKDKIKDAGMKDNFKKAVRKYARDMNYASRLENDAADYKKDANRALQQAKEKHAAKKKNESLSEVRNIENDVTNKKNKLTESYHGSMADALFGWLDNDLEEGFGDIIINAINSVFRASKDKNRTFERLDDKRYCDDYEEYLDDIEGSDFLYDATAFANPWPAKSREGKLFYKTVISQCGPLITIELENYGDGRYANFVLKNDVLKYFISSGTEM